MLKRIIVVLAGKVANINLSNLYAQQEKHLNCRASSRKITQDIGMV